MKSVLCLHHIAKAKQLSGKPFALHKISLNSLHLFVFCSNSIINCYIFHIIFYLFLAHTCIGLCCFLFVVLRRRTLHCTATLTFLLHISTAFVYISVLANTQIVFKSIYKKLVKNRCIWGVELRGSVRKRLIIFLYKFFLVKLFVPFEYYTM